MSVRQCFLFDKLNVFYDICIRYMELTTLVANSSDVERVLKTIEMNRMYKRLKHLTINVFFYSLNNFAFSSVFLLLSCSSAIRSAQAALRDIFKFIAQHLFNDFVNMNVAYKKLISRYPVETNCSQPLFDESSCDNKTLAIANHRQLHICTAHT